MFTWKMLGVIALLVGVAGGLYWYKMDKMEKDFVPPAGEPPPVAGPTGETNLGNIIQNLKSEAQLLETKGQRAEAIRLLEEAIGIDSQDFQARVQLSYLYMEEGFLDKAESHLNYALESGVESPGIYVGLSHLSELRGDLEGALMMMEKAIGLEPDNKHLKGKADYLKRRMATEGKRAK